MPAKRSRADPDGSHDDANSRADRRTFLRRTAGVGAAAVGVGAVTVGDARGQEGTATGTEADEEKGTVVTRGAFAADAPTLGNPDYAGLFVHVAGVNQDASTRDVSGCPFVGSDDAVVAYDVTVIDRESADTPQGDTLLFAEVNDDTVEYGKLFIVTGQQPCGSGHVQVQLEEVGAANIRTGTARVGMNDGDETERGTATRLPGLGVVAAVGGLLGGGELLRRRGSE